MVLLALPALELSTFEPWLAHTVRRRSTRAHEAPAVIPSSMAMDESDTRWQGRARVRQGLPRKPEGAGVEISPMISMYNSSMAGVDRSDARVVSRVVFEQQVLPEDVIR